MTPSYIIKTTVVSLFLFTMCGNLQDETSVTIEEVENLAIAIWTEKSELYMEYPPIEVGKEVSFHVHLTDLEKFKPITSGKLKIVFTNTANESTTAEVNAPDRPGIFKPVITINKKGLYTMELHLESNQVNDVIIVENVRVGDVEAPTEHEHTTTGAELVSFLKEQQWIIDFKTEIAEGHVIQNSFLTTGTLEYDPKNYSEVSSPVDGIVSVKNNKNLPTIGSSELINL